MCSIIRGDAFECVQRIIKVQAFVYSACSADDIDSFVCFRGKDP